MGRPCLLHLVADGCQYKLVNLFGKLFFAMGSKRSFFFHSVTCLCNVSPLISEKIILLIVVCNSCDTAQFLSIPSPVPYRQRKFGKKLIRYGMNFAYGGAGVFDTSVRQHNLTTQIGNLEQLIAQKVYLKNDMEFSIALVSLAGSDYATYLNNKGSVWVSADCAVKTRLHIYIVITLKINGTIAQQ